MKTTTKILFLLALFFSTTILLSSCSKDDKKKVDPEQENPDNNKRGTASATVLYTDNGETLMFDGSSNGVINKTKDTAILQFRDEKSKAAFLLVIATFKKGENILRKNDFYLGGIFYPDSSKTNILKSYLLGWDNFDENDDVEDAATFNISILESNRMKGTFSATLILNTTVKENGEIIKGEIKTMTVTKGKFDVPLITVDD